jgi:hypothetical protein
MMLKMTKGDGGFGSRISSLLLDIATLSPCSPYWGGRGGMAIITSPHGSQRTINKAVWGGGGGCEDLPASLKGAFYPIQL